jgi:hypothetical protein
MSHVRTKMHLHPKKIEEGNPKKMVPVGKDVRGYRGCHRFEAGFFEWV